MKTFLIIAITLLVVALLSTGAFFAWDKYKKEKNMTVDEIVKKISELNTEPKKHKNTIKRFKNHLAAKGYTYSEVPDFVNGSTGIAVKKQSDCKDGCKDCKDCNEKNETAGEAKTQEIKKDESSKKRMAAPRAEVTIKDNPSSMTKSTADNIAAKVEDTNVQKMVLVSKIKGLQKQLEIVNAKGSQFGDKEKRIKSEGIRSEIEKLNSDFINQTNIYNSLVEALTGNGYEHKDGKAIKIITSNAGMPQHFKGLFSATNRDRTAKSGNTMNTILGNTTAPEAEFADVIQKQKQDSDWAGVSM